MKENSPNLCGRGHIKCTHSVLNRIKLNEREYQSSNLCAHKIKTIFPDFKTLWNLVFRWFLSDLNSDINMTTIKLANYPNKWYDFLYMLIKRKISLLSLKIKTETAQITLFKKMNAKNLNHILQHSLMDKENLRP